MPAINAEQVPRAEVISGLFQHFARHGGQQRLISFQMSGRLVEAQSLRGFLLHQQKFTIAFNDGGDSDVGFPDHVVLCKNKKAGFPLLSSGICRITGQQLQLSWLFWLSSPFLLFWLSSQEQLLPWRQRQERRQRQVRQEQRQQQEQQPWRLERRQQQRRRKKQRQIQQRSVQSKVCS